MDNDYLIKKPPLQALFLFALPMIIGNLFQQTYTMVDSAIVGRYVSEQALAAVGASYALTNIFICVAIGGWNWRVGDRKPVFWREGIWTDEDGCVYSSSFFSWHQSGPGNSRTDPWKADHDMVEYPGRLSGYGVRVSADLFPGAAVFVYV